MFIEDVITKIREPYTVQFNKVFKQANQMETEELYPSVLKDIEGLCKQLPYPPDEKLALRDSAFATTGCPHWINNYHFAGCTMCNYFAFHIDYLAKMKTLRDRDVRLYAKAVRYSLDLQIGKAPESFFAELITANDTLNPEEFVESIKRDLFADEVYVYTPKSKLLRMPLGSTPIDFAYRIHTDLGNRCAEAHVNGRIVPLNYELQTGDTVEIVERQVLDHNAPRPLASPLPDHHLGLRKQGGVEA